MSVTAARAADASDTMASPQIATTSTPKRAINSEPGIAASANMLSGMPIKSPTWVSLMCRSSWMSGITGGTASSGMRMVTPASQSSDSTVTIDGDAGLSPGMGGRFIRTPRDPARVLDPEPTRNPRANAPPNCMRALP